MVGRGLVGRPVLLVLSNGPSLICAFWGALLAGALPAILTPPRAFGDAETWALRLRGLHEACDGAPVLCSPAVASMLGGTQAGAAIPCWRVEELDAPPSPRPPPDPGAPALLQLTSGSVGRPKGVVLSHRAVVANARAISERGQFSGADLAAFWVPMAHDMALLAHLACAAAGTPQVVLPTEHFARNPAGWLTLCPGELSLSVGPPFAFELARQRLLRLDKAPDLSGLRALIVGAEPIDASILRRFTTDLAPLGLRPDLFMPCYGMAEVTCVATLGVPGEPVVVEKVARPLALGSRATLSSAPGAAEVVGNGPPLQGVELRVVRDDSSLAPAGEIGHVQVRSPAALDRYWRDQERSAEVLAGSGWVRSGDLGWMRGDRVYIAGRHKHVIIRRGRNVLPEEIEELALSVPGVRTRGALAFGEPDPTGGPERVTLLVEADAGVEEQALVRALRVRVADALDLALDSVQLVPHGSLPRTTSGKLQRGVARERWGSSP